MIRFLSVLVLVGCADLDPTLECHSEHTRGGVGYTACAVDGGDSFIRTPFGDVGCVRGRFGGPDCTLTAEVYIGEVYACIDDAQVGLSEDFGYPEVGR